MIVNLSSVNAQSIRSGWEIIDTDFEEDIFSIISTENDVLWGFGESGLIITSNDRGNSWEKIDLMLDKIMSSSYRNQYLDSCGNGVVYNWHCMDNVGFNTNERRRSKTFWDR